MTDKYGSHTDFMGQVAEDAERRKQAVEKGLRLAFGRFIEQRQVEVIVFSSMSVFDLAKALGQYPIILKPLLVACNLAARAIERDLEIKNLDTYSPRLANEEAAALAGYMKPFLPDYLELPALSVLDRVAFIDKEIRKGKGRWEQSILKALNSFGSIAFKKRKFECHGEEFEMDAAAPPEGRIEVGIDVKRIEARRDIHKRCDEIVNKANKFKTAFPEGKFAAVIYYPFIDEHVNIQNRLQTDAIDAIVFASESEQSVNNAVLFLLSRLGVVH